MKNYEYVIRLTLKAEDAEDVKNQLEEYDFNNAIDKGYIKPEIREVQE